MGEVSVKLENYIIAFGTLTSNMPYPPKYIYFSEVDNGDFIVYSPEYGTLQTFGDSVQLKSLQHAEVVSAFKTYERKVIEEEVAFKAYERECMETGKRMVSPTTVDLATFKAHIYGGWEEDGVPDHNRSNGTCGLTNYRQYREKGGGLDRYRSNGKCRLTNYS